MSAAQPACFSTGSTDSARTFTPRLSNSGLILASAPSSVVQMGVKSFGCEKIAPQESPSHSWRLIVPSLDSAVKSGAVSPIVKLIFGSVPETDSGTAIFRVGYAPKAYQSGWKCLSRATSETPGSTPGREPPAGRQGGAGNRLLTERSVQN